MNWSPTTKDLGRVTAGTVVNVVFTTTDDINTLVSKFTSYCGATDMTVDTTAKTLTIKVTVETLPTGLPEFPFTYENFVSLKSGGQDKLIIKGVITP